MSGDRNSPRFDVVASTRRQFSREQKLAIVAEVESGATVCEVARRHNVHSSLLFRCQRKFLAVRLRSLNPKRFRTSWRQFECSHTAVGQIRKRCQRCGALASLAATHAHFLIIRRDKFLPMR
jgi:transposase-like protein